MITYGFYDSDNHDRRYNAIQFGSIFDGIIRDGIFMSIGTCFRVTPSDGMMILVGVGRAWFNHTWTLNDAPLPLNIPQSELLLDRIDAVVLDINSDREVRANDVIIIKGTPSKNPERPNLINEASRHQYPLAYVLVKANATSIRDADITSMIGTSQTPYVTGILETVNIDALLDQWQDQWQVFFENQTEEIQNTFLYWETDMEETSQYWKDRWYEWFYTYTNQSQNGLSVWINDTESNFTTWWDSLKDILDENCCANLAKKVLELELKVKESEDFQNSLLTKHEMYDIINDSRYDQIIGHLTNQDNVELTNDQGEMFDAIGISSGEPILDTEMNPIKGTLKIAIL